MCVYIGGNLYNFPREYIVQQWQHHHKSLANKFFQYIHFFTAFTFYFHRSYFLEQIDCICAYSNLLTYAYVRASISRIARRAIRTAKRAHGSLSCVFTGPEGPGERDKKSRCNWRRATRESKSVEFTQRYVPYGTCVAEMLASNR